MKIKKYGDAWLLVLVFQWVIGFILICVGFLGTLSGLSYG
jgi:hypothetical protein